MTTTGIFVLVGLAVLSVAACVGHYDNSECKTDHAFIWFTATGALAIILRIFMVLFYQHSSWWAYYGSYDYLQGAPVAIFVAYLWNESLLFPGGWRLATFTISVAIVIAIVLVFGGLVIWPIWLACWTANWLVHKFG
ncbi:MAG: hypothetical protein V1807_02165 [Patescibacteria group bacterium]